MTDRLVVRGAREHNLHDVSLDLPRDRLIVFTGLSGSGKSSLAFDTIYAEGQRRYVESLSAYARQFLGQMDKPDVDFIEGLSPAISIDQKSASRNPRSTVGTVTEVYDYLRLLYARIGKPHCPTCGRPVFRQSPQQIVDRILAMEEGTRFMVLAPVVRGRKGEYSGLLEDLARQGFSRVRVDGQTVELAERAAVDLARYEQHTIEVVVDRLVRRDDVRRRLTESLETALGLADGVAEIVVVGGDGVEEEAITFSQHLACTHCGTSFEEPAPATSPSTRPTGRARPAPAWAHASKSIPTWSCPTRPSRWPRGRWRRGRAGAARDFAKAVEAVADMGGFSVDEPWEQLGEADRGPHPLRHRRPAGQPPLPQPLRPPADVHDRLRGDRHVAPAPAQRGRLGLGPRQPRGVPARGSLPRVRGRPPAAGVAGGDGRRPEHLRAVLAVDRPGRRRRWPTSTCPSATTSSPTGCSARSGSGCSFCWTSGWTT